jgi:hypothetical protein
MRADFQFWLEQQSKDTSTVAGQLNRATRVEKNYGNLDKHYAKDRLQSIIDNLTYTQEDERKRRPNPSKINFEGNIRNTLSLFRYAVEQYRRFRDSENDAGHRPSSDIAEPAPAPTSAGDDDVRQRTVLERDMQASLRANIEQLEPGLEVADNGVERTVESGSIPIMARDPSGAMVVIELRGSAAGRRAVAHMLSLMGDVAAEDPDVAVRGILVAPTFEKNARAAARMAPSLSLVTFTFKLEFAPLVVTE